MLQNIMDYALQTQAVIETVGRIGVSKNGVNYAGSKRKDQMVSSHIVTYPNINKSKQGYFWKAIGAANADGEVTVRSLIKALLNNVDNVDKFIDNNRGIFANVNTLKNYIMKNNVLLANPPKSLEYYLQDLDLVLKDVVIIVDRYYKTGPELDVLSKLTRKQNITNKEFIDFVENSSKRDEIVLKSYVKAIKTLNPNAPVKAALINELFFYYFTDKQTVDFFKKNGNKNLQKGYLDQYLIERVSINKLSNLIQETISVAKHGGLDQDTSERAIIYQRKVDKETTAHSLRKVFTGTGLEHIVGTAINADRDMILKVDTEIEGTSLSDLNKAYYREFPNTVVAMKDIYTDETDANFVISELSKNRGKLILFGHLYVSNTMMKEVDEKIKALNVILLNYKDLTVNKKELEDIIQYFNYRNIPFYKLIRYVKDALSIRIAVKNQYDLNNTDQLSIQKHQISNYVNRLLSFAYYLKEDAFKKDFDKSTVNEILINGFFNNVLSLDDTFTYRDAENNLRSVYLNEFEQADIELDIRSNPNIKVRKQLQDNLEYIYFKNDVESLKNIIDETINQYAMLLKSRELLDEGYKASQADIIARRLLTRAEIISKDLRIRNLINYDSIAKSIRNITELVNERNKKQPQIKNLEKEIIELKLKLNNAVEQLRVIQAGVVEYSKEDNFNNRIESEILDLQSKLNQVEEDAMERAVSEHLGSGYLLLQDGGTVADSTIQKPRYLTIDDDIIPFKNKALLSMSNELVLFKNSIDNTSKRNKKMSLKQYYRFIKLNQGEFKFVQILPADSDEGLYRDFLSYIRKYDESIDDELFASPLKKNTLVQRTLSNLRLVDNSKYRGLQFESIDQLVRWQEAGNKVVFNGKVYDKIVDPKKLFEEHRQLMPTYKEIVVTSVDDLEKIYDDHITKGTLVGVVDLNTWMQTMEQVYNPIQPNTKIEQFYSRLLVGSKNLSKFSAPFLFRNLTDTVKQLFTNAYIQPSNITLQKYYHLTLNSLQIYNMYKKLSEEHTLAIMNVGAHYKDLLAHIEAGLINKNAVQNKLNLLLENLESYIAIGSTLESDGRIKNRVREAQSLYRKLQAINIEKLGDYKILLKQVVGFIADLRFGEFLEMYDNRVIGGTLVAGLRVDNKDVNGNIINHKTLNQRYKEFNLMKPLVKNLSAFMNTAASTDYLRQDRFKLLPNVFEQYPGYTEPNQSRSYEQLEDMLKEAEKNSKTFLNRDWFSRSYNNINEYIENAARITNFFYNMELYNMSYEASVRDSLKHWFNYGQRSPLETRLLTDMPFVSFPLRSVGNWIERLMNPRYWRLMSDFIDGWYGQYQDEDKEYNDYTKYQITRGWLPLADNFGIRVGSGSLDVMNIIYNTQQTIEERRSPLLRGISKLVETGNLTEAMKQFASFGLIGRITNTITGTADMVFNTELRAGLADSPVAGFVDTRQATLGNTYRGFFYDINSEYSKFTPNRYRYENNGRWARYENIYKDWFTKYGKMRKPTVDPMSLVKNIQWRTYVRYRRAREMNKK